MTTKSTKTAFLTIIGSILLASVMTMSCNSDKKKAEDKPVITTPVTDTIPVSDTSKPKDVDPPKPKTN